MGTHLYEHAGSLSCTLQCLSVCTNVILQKNAQGKGRVAQGLRTRGQPAKKSTLCPVISGVSCNIMSRVEAQWHLCRLWRLLKVFGLLSRPPSMCLCSSPPGPLEGGMPASSHLCFSSQLVTNKGGSLQCGGHLSHLRKKIRQAGVQGQPPQHQCPPCVQSREGHSLEKLL